MAMTCTSSSYGEMAFRSRELWSSFLKRLQEQPLALELLPSPIIFTMLISWAVG